MKRALRLLMLSVAVLSAQPPNLGYGPRSMGKYYEGRSRGKPSNGPSLDLVAALILHNEPAHKTKPIPPKFYSSFYIPPGEQVTSVTVQELQPRYFYWLDQVKQSWTSGTNVFEWPTDQVFAHLNYDNGPLTLGDLGAVARVGPKLSSQGNERVLPMALYHSSPPAATDGYVFVFFPGSAFPHLNFTLTSDAGSTPVAKPQAFDNISAEEPFWVRYRRGDWPTGWYCLSYSGPINGIVRFYHVKPR